MKKCLVSVLICLILTNFICINFCYSYDEEAEIDLKSGFEQANNEGTANIGDNSLSVDVKYNAPIILAIKGIAARGWALLPMLVQYIITDMLNGGGIVVNKPIEISEDFELFSIKHIITGRYYFLDANIFRDSDKDVKKITEIPYYSVSDKQFTTVDFTIAKTLNNMRKNVAKWFVIIRDIALAINLVVLAYVAIRAIIATVAQEKAKYKELIFNWVMSILILFMLPYIFSIINNIADLLVNFVLQFMKNIESSGGKSFEYEIMYQVINKFFSFSMSTYVMFSVIYFALVWIQLKFFLMYGKRMLTVFFLIIISPIITITYAIDKIGDGKAQAFSKWLSEYLNNMLIQPLHCFIYMVFMFSANNIAQRAPMVGVIFLLSLTKAETIVKKLLNVSSATVENVGDKFSVKDMTKKLKGMIPKGG